ncbi:hypothetical protein ASPVEDRAFT_40764 [Aspergillus versicolor CBS 583.65]|uniref:Uncharacterized protein n=1 Tax=Aspergillus versicolor CBS 583.65 TaxID=1036611 RepID=A0A1L9PI74_ASPVE|nr:uncharacterized protein ASPVEDRAFT_40764 [Aspergillus versicolor CBS 583.65]OJJ01208.1 hypothetical protein ASPVEDRAFT_40764 [Aspergillus versicolor CBS 583.65]
MSTSRSKNSLCANKTSLLFYRIKHHSHTPSIYPLSGSGIRTGRAWERDKIVDRLTYATKR